MGRGACLGRCVIWRGVLDGGRCSGGVRGSVFGEVC